MQTVVHARSQVANGVLTIGPEPVRLSWQVSGAGPDVTQLAYEIEVAADPAFATVLVRTGGVDGDAQIGVEAPGGPLDSREVRFHRVRIRTGAGWSDWCAPVRVEANLLRPEDWVAEAVTLPDDPGSREQAPSPIVRRTFELSGAVRSARLYVTSLGVHEVVINGTRVGSDHLSPGWTTYHHRLITESHDVTDLLTPGANAIAATLGDGWYRGRLGWDPAGGNDRRRYGDELGLIAQLEVTLDDGTHQVIATDGSWQASTAEVRRADLYDGALIDLRAVQPGAGTAAFAADGWVPVRVVPFEKALLEPRIAPPVRVITELPTVRSVRPDGSISLDGGQNIAGWVRLRVRGTRGQTVTIRHAEVLEPDGALHTRSLRSAKATDAYVLADDGEVILEPRFTFHGFRFAEVVTDATLLDATFIAISSATPRRSTFTCAHPMLERFHENVVWSQRDNFVSVPTDCPQRDERLGWTGDAQAFAPTGCTLFDSEAFWTSWLRDLELDQDDELGVPAVVPDLIVDGTARFGRAGWADAATIVPWAVHESFGDAAVLRRQLSSVRRWIASYEGRLEADGLLGPGMQFGDWLDPDAPADRPWEAKTDSTYLANAFLVRSARLAAAIARHCGDAEWAAHCDALADEVGTRTWARWRGHAVTTQTGCATALRFRIVPEAERSAVADALARLVRDARGRVATGFLGVSLVLPALSEAGHFDEAYLMLLRTDLPSWLYQVKMGATTVWERWDAIFPDGTIHPGTMKTPPEMADRAEGEPHMLSFNHYAYGAVIDWVYRNLAGLAPDEERPGYRHVIVAPRPVAGIDHAEAAVETPFGRASVAWRLDGAERLMLDVELPFGATGTIRPPVQDGSTVTMDGAAAGAEVPLGPGRHTLVVTRPLVAHPPA
jgi:alpha-L-rhamnosidase